MFCETLDTNSLRPHLASPMMKPVGVMRLLDSFEGFLLANFLMDALLIGAVSRLNDCFSAKRVLLASMLASLIAALAAEPVPWLAQPVFQMLAMVLTAMITVRDANPWRWGAFSAQLLAGTTLIGGLSQFFHPKTGLWRAGVIALGLMILSLALAMCAGRTRNWMVTVSISFRGKQARFRALIDTGNRLREPLSGLPVLIAEEKLLNGLDFSGVKFRNVAFGGLGGGGTLRCFRPEAVYLIQNGHKRRVSDVCVAIYEGIVPGSARALAPPSFAVLHGGQLDSNQKGAMI